MTRALVSGCRRPPCALQGFTILGESNCRLAVVPVLLRMLDKWGLKRCQNVDQSIKLSRKESCQMGSSSAGATAAAANPRNLFDDRFRQKVMEWKQWHAGARSSPQVSIETPLLKACLCVYCTLLKLCYAPVHARSARYSRPSYCTQN